MKHSEDRIQNLERRLDQLEEQVPMDLLGQLNEIKKQLDRLDKAIVKLSFDTSGGQ